MKNEITVKQEASVNFFSDEQVELLKRTIAKDATRDELDLFVNQCKRTGLDPFTRQIYFIKDKGGKVTICSSIDGLRLVAERTEKYQGQTKAEWCGEDGQWKDIWLDKQPPSASRVGVYKANFKEPLYAVAIFDEYAGRYQWDDSRNGKYKKGDLTHMWAKMPSLMIAKVAEALALRKAFPNDLSGIYSQEEANTIEQPEKDVKAAKEITRDWSKLSPVISLDEIRPNTGDYDDHIVYEKVASKNEAPISSAQQKKLFEVAEMVGIKPSAIQEILKKDYGIEKSALLKVWQFEELVSEFKGIHEAQDVPKK